MKKLVILIVILSITCLGISSYAAETEATITTDYISSATVTEEITVTEEVPITTAVTDTSAVSTADNLPLGEWLWQTAKKFALEIIAIVILILSTILAWTTKYNLFPFVRSVLEKIIGYLQGSEKSFDNWKKQADKEIKEYREATDAKLAQQQKELAEYREQIAEALKRVSTIADVVAKEGKLIITCLNDQEDTLNTIVQSSSLAQWKKDEAGAKHAAHVAALADLRGDPNEGGEKA